MKSDSEAREDIRTLLADLAEIHEVIAKAWQDIFRRWDKEVRPTWQNFERSYQHLWKARPQMQIGELQVDQMMKMIITWGAKKAAGPNGWARSEWKQMTPAMVKQMRDMMTKMEETVENMTMEQLLKDPVWPAAVRTAEVALIPKEANQTPTPLDLRPITVTCLLYNLWAGTRFVEVIRWCTTWLPKSIAGGIPESRIQECVWTVLLAMEGEEEGVVTAAIDSSKFFDMIVWEVVFPMMGKVGVPDRIWKLQANFVFHPQNQTIDDQDDSEEIGVKPLSYSQSLIHSGYDSAESIATPSDSDLEDEQLCMMPASALYIQERQEKREKHVLITLSDKD